MDHAYTCTACRYPPVKSAPQGHTSNILSKLARVGGQEAKYVEGWPYTTSAWAGWSRFDIPVDRYDGVHSLLRWRPSKTLGSPTCH
jgi:hypothetical protein